MAGLNGIVHLVTGREYSASVIRYVHYPKFRRRWFNRHLELDLNRVTWAISGSPYVISVLNGDAW